MAYNLKKFKDFIANIDVDGSYNLVFANGVAEEVTSKLDYEVDDAWDKKEVKIFNIWEDS